MLAGEAFLVCQYIPTLYARKKSFNYYYRTFYYEVRLALLETENRYQRPVGDLVMNRKGSSRVWLMSMLQLGFWLCAIPYVSNLS